MDGGRPPIHYSWPVIQLPIQFSMFSFRYYQLDSSTIDGNVESVHSQYTCILTSQVSTLFLCPTK